MSNEFQIIRWGIPGWVFLITYFSFKMSLYDFKLSGFIGSFQNPTAITGIAAFFAAAGVPIGYIIYQVYFLFKWDLRFKKENPMYKAIEGIEELKSKMMNKTHEDWQTIERSFDHYMSVIANKKDINYKDIERRQQHYANRTSRVHGLGASFTALILGGIVSIVLEYSRIFNTGKSVLLILGYAFVCMAVYANYRAQNINTFVQFNAIMKDILDAEEKKEKKDEK
jgi:hypothetical protein